MRYHLKYMQLWALFLFTIKVKQEEDRKAFFDDPLKVEASFDQVLNSIPRKSDRDLGYAPCLSAYGFS